MNTALSTSSVQKSQNQQELIHHPRMYNVRACPRCDKEIYGMPGGRDAHCSNCGYKDPCCSD